MFRTRFATALSALCLVILSGPVQADPAVSTVVAFSGSSAVGNLVKGTDGALYGTTSAATSATGGLIYRTTADGSSVRTLYQLKIDDGVTPGAGLTLGGDDGLLYGITKFGKAGDLNGAGTVFKLAPDGTGFAVVYRFDAITTINVESNAVNPSGAYPEGELIHGSDDFLYGAARSGGANGTGTIFRLQRNGSGFQVLHMFDKNKTAADSIANTEWSAPVLSGTDGVDGVAGYSTAVITAYKRSASAPTDKPGAITYTFATSAWTPANGWSASIPDGSDPLYAVSATANSQGATDTVEANEWSALVVLGQNGAADLVSAPVFLYQRTATNVAPAVATTSSTIYTFATGAVSGQPAGWTRAIPGSASGAFLWVIQATASNTAAANAGQVFNVDGAAPTGQLLELNGYIYGTASAGGPLGRGVVFRLKLDGTGFQLLHQFSVPTADATTGLLENPDGYLPFGGLVADSAGLLYGTTTQGGPTGYGVVYMIDPTNIDPAVADPSGTTPFTVLHAFNNTDGARPLAELTLGSDGKLYGTTSSGGVDTAGAATTLGTLFSINRDGTGFTRLFSFAAANGTNPSSRVLEYAPGVLMGLNGSAGNCSSGTLWRYSTAGDTVTGNTRCGQKKNNNSGGGAFGFGVLLLLGGLGLYRRRTA